MKADRSKGHTTQPGKSIWQIYPDAKAKFKELKSMVKHLNATIRDATYEIDGPWCCCCSTGDPCGSKPPTYGLSWETWEDEEEDEYIPNHEELDFETMKCLIKSLGVKGKEFHMSNAQSQTMAPVQRVTPKAIRSPWADIAVYGWELVSPKFMDVLTAIFEAMLERDPGVRCIVFHDDNRPQGAMARSNPELGTMGLNLMEIFSQALVKVIDMPYNSIWSSYHTLMVNTVLHELHHIDNLQHSGELLDLPVKDSDMSDTMYEAALKAHTNRTAEIEDAADNWAFDTMIDLARSGLDMEPGPYHEDPFFLSQLDQMNDLGDHFLADQKFMLENHLMFYRPESRNNHELTYRRFKEICMIMNDVADPEGTDWLDDGYEESAAPISRKGESINTWVRRKAAETVTAEKMAAEEVEEAKQTIQNAGYEDAQVEPEKVVVSEAASAEGGNLADSTSVAPSEGAYANDPVMSELDEMVQPEDEEDDSWVDGYHPDIPDAEPMAQQAYQAATPQPAADDIADGPIAPTLPDHGLDQRRVQELVFGVFNRMFDRFFSPKENGGCGPLLQSDLPFIDPDAAVRTPIQLTPEEQQVIVAYQGFDDQGRGPMRINVADTRDGWIRGGVYQKSKLPYFIVYINMNGHEVGRKIMPQNTAKRGNVNGYTRTASMARGGTRIMYTFEELPGNQQGAYLWKRVDNAWMAPNQRL